MKRFLFATLAALSMTQPSGPLRADEKEATDTLDKAIKAAGGEEALGKARVLTWKTKGTITFNGNENEISGRTTAQGLDRYRAEFEGEFNGNSFKGVTVLDGDKGWRKFGENAMELDENAVANEKRNVYLQVAPALLVPLKGKGFKLTSAAEEKVGDKPASVIKATGPDGKDFTIYFDKETGLPVKTVARVAGFNGTEFEQETSFADYKDFGGIKKATKISTKRDGERFVDSVVTEFKVLDKADADAFAEPQ